MGCEAGRERRRPVNGVRGGPGEAIEAGSEWGARRAAGGDRSEPGEATEAGSEWGVWILVPLYKRVASTRK